MPDSPGLMQTPLISPRTGQLGKPAQSEGSDADGLKAIVQAYNLRKAAEEGASQQGLLRNFAESIGHGFARPMQSLGLRVLGRHDEAEDQIRMNQALQTVAAARDPEIMDRLLGDGASELPLVGRLPGAVRGGTQSLLLAAPAFAATAAGTAVGGPAGGAVAGRVAGAATIGTMFGGTSYNESLVEAKDRGLDADASHLHAAGQAALEVGVMALFGAAGRGGMEKTLMNLGKQEAGAAMTGGLLAAIGQASKQFGRDYMDELTEELITAHAQTVASHLTGVAEEDLTLETIRDTSLDVALETLFAQGVTSAASGGNSMLQRYLSEHDSNAPAPGSLNSQDTGPEQTLAEAFPPTQQEAETEPESQPATEEETEETSGMEAQQTPPDEEAEHPGETLDESEQAEQQETEPPVDQPQAEPIERTDEEADAQTEDPPIDQPQVEPPERTDEEVDAEAEEQPIDQPQAEPTERPDEEQIEEEPETPEEPAAEPEQTRPAGIDDLVGSAIDKLLAERDTPLPQRRPPADQPAAEAEQPPAETEQATTKPNGNHGSQTSTEDGPQIGEVVTFTNDAGGKTRGLVSSVGTDGTIEITDVAGRKTNRPLSEIARDESPTVYPPEQTKPQAGLGQTTPAPEQPAVQRDYGTGETPNRITLGEHFADRLSSGNRYTSINQARREVSDLVGSPIKAGTPQVKDVDEAVEQGVVRTARKIVQDSRAAGQDDIAIYDALVDLYERQPVLGSRTSTSVADQAYSTPAPLAWAANMIVGTQPNHRTLDSSAGNGMLLIASNNAVANELNPHRAAALEAQGIETTAGDAMEMPITGDYDRVIINPPFGKVTTGLGKTKQWDVGGVKTQNVDHAITLQSLQQLKDDGKAAIIIGAKGFNKREPLADDQRATAYLRDAPFWKTLYDNYNVTDHFSVHGDLYQRQGASFPVDVIIVEGKGASQRAMPFDADSGIPRTIRTWDELKNETQARRTEQQSGSGPTTGVGNSVTGGVASPTGGQTQGNIEAIPTRSPVGGVGGTDRGAGRPRSGLGKPRKQPKVSGDASSKGSVADTTAQGGSQSQRGGDAGRPDGLRSEPSVAPKTLSDKAAAANARAAAALEEFAKLAKSKGLASGLDPELAAVAARYAIAKVEAGVYSFAAFADQFAREVPGQMAELWAPYFESAWQYVYDKGLVDDPAGKIVTNQEISPRKQHEDYIEITDPRDDERGLKKWDIFTTPKRPGKFLLRTDHTRAAEIYDTLEEAKQARDNAQRREQERKQQEERAEAKDKAAAEAEAKLLESYQGYFDTGNNGKPFTDMQRGRIRRYLEKQVRHHGKVTTYKDLIESSVRDGWTLDENGELRSGDTYRNVGKTGAKYAQFLLDKKAEPAQDKKPNETAETEHQATYLPGSKNRSVGTLVPRNHVDAIAKAMESIAEKYGDPDAFVAKELGYTIEEFTEHFSAEQADALAMAIARHKEGLAFIIGDGTGVGKGRAAAGMIEYARAQGLVPVFVTEKPTLYADMIRDLTDIGRNTEDKPFQPLVTNTISGKKDEVPLPDGRVLSQTDAVAKKRLRSAITHFQKSGKLTSPAGRLGKKTETFDAIFTTYAQMQPVRGKETERVQLLKAIAPKAFYIFDESHNAAGVIQEKPDQSTFSRAEAAQTMANKSAGVYFSSATYAKSPESMPLYAKTGMAEATEGDTDKLVEAIKEGGVPLQQAISGALVESGMYFRRERSYDGVDFETEISPVNLEELDQIAEIFRGVNDFSKIAEAAISKMAKELAKEGKQHKDTEAVGSKGITSVSFASIMHNVIDQMLLAVKADAMADAAIKAVKNNESPVIYIDSTMEKALENYLEGPGLGAQQGDPIDFSFRDLLRRYLERSREYTVMDRTVQPPKAERRYLTDVELGDDGVAAYAAAESLIDHFAAELPASPIDWVRKRIQDAGYSVAEITGRKLAIDYAKDGTPHLGERQAEEIGTAGRIATVKRFNSGELDVAIINQSGSTGISMHASESFANQKVRRMIIGQPARNIDTFMQALGRVHRTGQVVTPTFTLLMTDSPAEKRPAGVLSRKLRSLNANVTASGKGAVSFDTPDVINIVGDQIIGAYLLEDPVLNEQLGSLAQPGDLAFRGVAAKATGRMALRPVSEQIEFWDTITEAYNSHIDELNRTNTNPLNAQTLDLQAVTQASEVIFAGDSNSQNVFAQPAVMERILANKVGKPFTAAQIKEQVRSFYGSEPTIDAIEKKTAETLKDLQPVIDNYKKLAASRIKDPAKKEDARRRIDEDTRKFTQMLHSMMPGMTVSIHEKDGVSTEISDIVSGVVTNIKVPTSKSGSPLALSKWVAEIAVASTDRMIRVPLSRFDQTKKGSDRQSQYFTNNTLATDQELKEIEESAGAPTEIRYVATGNVLAAASKLSKAGGQITFFTTKDGQTRQGLLMPRTFSEEKWKESLPVTFDNAEQVINFTMVHGGVASTEDGILVIEQNKDWRSMAMRLTLPTRKAIYGKYALDPGIREAAGKMEFVKVGSRFQMLVTDEIRQRKILEAVAKISPIMAGLNKDVARRVVNSDREKRGVQETPAQPSPEGLRRADGIKDIPRKDMLGTPERTESILSPDKQGKQSIGAKRKTVRSAEDLVGDYETEAESSASSSPYAFPDANVERRWQASNGIKDTRTLRQRFQAFVERVKKATVRGSMPELPRTEQFSDARAHLREFRDADAYAMFAAKSFLNRTVRPLKGHDMDLFSRVIVLRDLAGREGLKPFGLTPETAQQYLEKMEQHVERNPRVAAALEYHKTWFEAVRDDYIDAHAVLGIDMTRLRANDDYFRHQVLTYYAINEGLTSGRGGRKAQVAMGRSFLQRAEGSEMDINSNYVEAMFEVASQMMSDTKRATALAKIEDKYNIRRKLVAQAKATNFENLVGGKDIAKKIYKLRAKREEATDPSELSLISKQLKAIDPTAPYRTEIARTSDQLADVWPLMAKVKNDTFFKLASDAAKNPTHFAHREALSYMAAVNAQQQFIRESLGDKFLEWEDLIPSTHSQVTLRDGRVMFSAYTLPERIALELQADPSKEIGISADQLQKVQALGRRYTPIVVPNEIASQMESMSDQPPSGALKVAIDMYRVPQRFWKRTVLLGPERFLRYNLRNMSEIEKVLVLLPSAARPDRLWKAFSDMYGLFTESDNMSPEAQEWMHLGGASSLMLVNEIGELAKDKELKKFFKDNRSLIAKGAAMPKGAWDKYWHTAGKVSNFRESILRYSAYLTYLEQIERNGRPNNYGGSYAPEIRGITDPKQKAFRLSADLLGDYGDLSPIGQLLRDFPLPFWSFQETNMRSYWNGVRNTVFDDYKAKKAGKKTIAQVGLSAAKFGPMATIRLGRVALLLYGAKAALDAWNNLFYGDEEDDLPEEVRRRPHIVLGRNPDGQVIYFDRLGTSTDVLDWFGLDTIAHDAKDVLDGRKTIQELAEDMAYSPINKLGQGVTPWFKTPSALLTKRDIYPDVRNPRHVRDRVEYLAQSFGVGTTYKLAAGKPMPPWSTIATNQAAYVADPGAGDYYNLLSMKYKWGEQNGSGGRGSFESPRSDALRYYKQAIRYDDHRAAERYLNEYMLLDGTAEGLEKSIAALHPLSGLNPAKERMFLATLNEDDQKILRNAEKYAYENLMTEEQAEKVKQQRAARLDRAVESAVRGLKTYSEADNEELANWAKENAWQPDVRSAIIKAIRKDQQPRTQTRMQPRDVARWRKVLAEAENIE